MATSGLAVDYGASTIKVASVRSSKNGISLARFGVAETKDGVRGLAGLGIPLGSGVVTGLAGKDMTLRYTQVPPSPDWQLRNLMDLEIQDLQTQSQGALSADYNLLPVADEDAGMDTILLALARDEALERVSGRIEQAGGKVVGHIPNCIALYNAYLRCAAIDDEDAVVCLANIGHETVDIALVRGQDLLVARNMSGGSKVFDDAIAAAFDVSERKAEGLKRELLDVDPQSRGRYASGQAEKVSVAAGGAGSMLVSAIQSSVLFCQSQTKIQGLALDRVLICGGGARLRGLRGMLRESLRCPVDDFDPFEFVDTTSLADDEHEQLDAYRSEAVVALGLALSVCDDELYALQILPEHVKKRQRFLQRTIWNIGAAAIGVGLLSLTAMRASSKQELDEQAATRLTRQATRLRRVHDEADEKIIENASKRGVVAAMATRTRPMTSLLRTLRVVQEVLPPELWIQSVESVSGSNRRSRRTGPAADIKVKGAGMPIGGQSVAVAFREFLRAFQAHALMEGVTVTPNESSIGGKLDFELALAFTRPDPEGD